jgi:homoserine O-succinyltransferase/O-acetyltransferase
VTVRLATTSRRDTVNETEPSSHTTCAFVNNMPDGAFDSTERQFLGLIDVASGSNLVEVRRYAMEGVPRGDLTSRRISEEYFPLVDLYLEPPDFLIVTGSSPVQLRIQDEDYWDDLVELLAWARKYVKSALLSCLSAHAALTVYDGIDRIRLLTKCTGVFAQEVDGRHELGMGIEPEILLPHSRWNSVSHDALQLAGYEVVVGSETTGWGVATREIEGHRLILVQGHPEYDPSSLLREYRRDAGRFVRGERDDLPFLPYHCASPDDWKRLERLHHEITEGVRDTAHFEQFPFEEVGERAPWPWRTMATRLYANWLTMVDRGGN